MNKTNLPPCKIEFASFRGWEAVILKNEITSLTAVPVIGGRVMAYDLGSYSFLYVDPNLAGKLFTPAEHMGDGSMPNWKNYGGDTTWPSPQGWSGSHEWPGPPDDILDSGHYQLTKNRINDDGSGEIEMTSPPDLKRTGIQITRHFKLQPGSSRVVQTISFKNVSDRVVNWSIWDVNQLNAERRLPDGTLEAERGCALTTPVNPHSHFSRQYNVMFGDGNNPQWKVDSEKGLFIGQYQWEIGKVGVDTQAGWASFSNSNLGYAMAEQFKYDPTGEYPDSGVSVEFWTVGRGRVSGLNYEGSGIYLMEVEILSPKYAFQPGESKTFEIEWGACCLSGIVIQAAPGGLWATPVKMTHTNKQEIRLTGKPGFFDKGELVADYKNTYDDTIHRIPLGKVSPLDLFHLDHMLPSVPGTSTINLVVKADFNGAYYSAGSIKVF